MVLDWISLCLAPGLGLTGFWRLVEHFGSPELVLAVGQTKLLKVPGIQPRQVGALACPEALRRRGSTELELLLKKGCLAVDFGDPAYPELLRQIADPPPVLFVRGRKELLHRSCLAIVGSRASTAYGRRTARSLAADLAPSLTIVSGMALGIDAEAHAGALSAGGETIAVLGCGLDVIYPIQNRRLYEQIGQSGLLVTEYPLGTTPEGFRFPARNRIIAGLSLGVLVVEAAKKSGSLITAQMALESGREVFAVPGQVDSFKSEGTHWLLKEGAKLVQSARDVLEELDLANNSGSESGKAVDIHSCTVDPDALQLLQHIEPYPQGRERLCSDSGLTAARLNQLLLLLELEGLIEMLPGDAVRKLSPGDM
ncbi:MAG: DNA-processing protein DprA [Desulfoprunum sp.]|uniref:DNA-processing protein DprA n=1 Tax=Desulfoprunum sp. TaxID=2020866 RepID=UPI003C7067B0